MPSKSPRKNTRKKRKIRRKEKIRTGIACGLLVTKKNAKKIPFEDVQNKTPKKKKKKKCFFNTKPLPQKKKIYGSPLPIYEKQANNFTPPPRPFS